MTTVLLNSLVVGFFLRPPMAVVDEAREDTAGLSRSVMEYIVEIYIHNVVVIYPHCR